MSKKKNKYSDKELLEFKALILSKLKEAQDDYSLLIGSLSQMMTTELMIREEHLI